MDGKDQESRHVREQRADRFHRRFGGYGKHQFRAGRPRGGKYLPEHLLRTKRMMMHFGIPERFVMHDDALRAGFEPFRRELLRLLGHQMDLQRVGRAELGPQIRIAPASMERESGVRHVQMHPLPRGKKTLQSREGAGDPLQVGLIYYRYDFHRSVGGM